MCTSFKKASSELCNSVGMAARRLCTDPKGLISLVACHLIAQGHSKGDWARYSGSEQRRRSCFGG